MASPITDPAILKDLVPETDSAPAITAASASAVGPLGIVRPGDPGWQGPTAAVAPTMPITDPKALSELREVPDAAPPPQVNTGLDMAGGALTGLVKGSVDTALMPVNAETGLHGLFSKYVTDPLFNAISGPAKPVAPATPGSFDDFARNTGSFINRGAGALEAPLYQPKTPYGQVSENIASFIPGAELGPGNVVRKAIAYGVVPGAVSEVAGRSANTLLGPEWEGPARFAGALAGGAAGHVAAGPAPTASILSGATRGVTDADIAAAQTFQAQVLAQQGIRLTPAQAIQHVTGGRSSLGNVQRVAESASSSAPVMRDFYADNPQRMDAAARRTFDQIAPAPTNITNAPPAVGMQGQAAATDALTSISQGINRAERPYYDAASTRTIPPQDLQFIAQDPAFQQALQTVRAQPIRYPGLEQFGANEAPVLIAVRQEMADMEQRALNPGAGQVPDRQLARGITPVRQRLDQIITNAAPEYGQALGVGSGLRQTVLDPATAGPLGQMRATPDVVAQGHSLYGSSSPGYHLATGDAVNALNGQNPAVAAAITRQHLESNFNQAVKNDRPGPDQFGGARYASRVMGDPQQAQNINAGLAALPNAATAQPAFNNLIDAFRATGERQPVGSNTTYNTEMLKELGKGNAAVGLGSLLASPEKLLSVVRESYLGRQSSVNARELARLLTNPDQFYDALNAARTAIPPHQYASALGRALAARAGIAGATASQAPTPIDQSR